MSADTLTVLGPIMVAVIGALGVWATGRLSSRAAEKSGALNGYASLTDQLQEERATLQGTIDKLREAVDTAQATANTALSTATRAEEMVTTLVREVEPIVAWIDAGAHPPPPSVSDTLRAILARHPRHG